MIQNSRKGERSVIIEWHTHVYPPEEAAADAGTLEGKRGLIDGPTWGDRCPMTVENVLDAHTKAGCAISVVSNAAHYMRGKADKDEFAAIQAGPITPPRSKTSTRAPSTALPRSCHAVGPPTSRRPSAPSAS